MPLRTTRLFLTLSVACSLRLVGPWFEAGRRGREEEERRVCREEGDGGQGREAPGSSHTEGAASARGGVAGGRD